MTDHSMIRVRGARENNLKNVSLDLPKHQITVFTGVSGSGKSSLVFDTIAAEAQRQLNETFTRFVQGFLPSYGQPDFDRIENLSSPIVIDQKRVGGGSRSTVGTFTELLTDLRGLYSRHAQPSAGLPVAYSFNAAQGMCPECEGIGKTVQLRLDRFLDESKSLAEGAILHPEFKVGGWIWKIYAESGLFDPQKPIVKYSKTERQNLIEGLPEGEERKVTFGGFAYQYEGLSERFARMYLTKDAASMSERKRAVFEQFVDSQTCPLCHGARLNQAALRSLLNGKNIAELCEMEAHHLLEFLKDLPGKELQFEMTFLLGRLEQLVGIGLGYLSLDRETVTLSGGESQRLKMIRHLGSSLTEMLYILDEPSVGLHPSDVARLNDLLRELRDKGNTVLVVEHDPDVIAIADHVVDIGPGAGTHGGEIVYQGNLAGLRRSGTLTGRFLTQQLPARKSVRQARSWLSVKGASTNNLKDIDVDFPEAVLTVVTGVSGAGKSTLVFDEFLTRYPDAIVIDQSRVAANVRSTPATYTGIMDEIRKLFARASGAPASLFSFNSEGSCPNCKGLGVTYTDLAFMEGVTSTCEVCGGKRFREDVLHHHLRGKSISDVLEMTVEEALNFFKEKKIRVVIEAMSEVGLGYLTLGQPLSTLSGGEGQRLKLAMELHKEGSIYVMDEPTTGLHLSNIGLLMKIIDRLVDAGNTVILIEHQLDVIRQADWLVDLGPGSGKAGGQVVFAGPPAELHRSRESALAEYV
ncbi:ATP-binding cassette domain-containing protein [Deinococcus antarcticus]|uniref:UvrABC system protein A n=1 Tax=Deinococcus antarcticus TaxID=1298767 RepID=A0ABV8AA53_9DEIO